MSKKNIFKQYLILAVTAFGLTVFQSCSEEIDMSDRYTFTEYTIASYLQEHDTTYSEYYRLLDEVKISKRSKSTVRQLMSARGNFTVFAPTNAAIKQYLDTLCAKGIIFEPSWDGFPDERTLDSIRGVIVYNSIIDGGNDNEAYQTSNFPNNAEEILLANMNDRKLTVFYGNNPDSIYINGNQDAATKIVTGGSLLDLKNRDIVAVNGCIHSVHQVVAPSNMTIGDKLKEMVDLGDERFSVTASLILSCGLFDELTKIKDEVYEEKYLNSEVPSEVKSSVRAEACPTPKHRKYGFTIFAETNEFWHNALHKDPADITLDDVKDWVIAQNLYPDAKDNGNYADPENVLNQFVTYHILPVRLSVDKLVIHYNEYGYYYSPATNPYTIPVWEFYTTLGKRRLLKLYGNANNPEDVYLNRFPILDNGRKGTYKEIGCDIDKQGIYINKTEALNIFNGYIYPIDQVLAYTNETAENLQKQRLRFDVAGLFPEFMNNDIRANRVEKDYTGIPVNEDYDREDGTFGYLDDLEILKGTNFCYLPGIGFTWQNFQGDELNVTGRYEMIFRLPPVPKEGTYEIRYAVQNNSDRRGMCQVYFGSSKKQMPAMGIPLDLRIGGTSDILGWAEDDKEDMDYNAEIDKIMRNNGFMKGPQGYHAGNASSKTARATQTTTRRIIVRQYMYPEKTYYLKFKSVLEDESKEFYMDYIEFCAKEVYDNPNEPEDIW